MIFKTICLTLLLFVLINAQEKYYTGAVVEYYSKYDDTASAGNNMQKNIDEYVKYIQEAKAKGADIIAFPEYGLTTTTRVESNIQIYTTVLPDPKNRTVVCNSTENWSTVIGKLSCAAKNNSIYVVVNLPERMKNNNQTIYYNTNIVFDRTGALIARYRQFNTDGTMFNKTETPDLTTFETDFGVTFGTFTTFDILFSQPSIELLRKNNKVTDIIYTTSWESQLPFLTSVQMQVGWARANGVNLLAASYCDPTNYHGGSGIYQANGNIYNNIPGQQSNSLLIRKISKISARKDSESIDNSTARVDKFKNSTGLELSTKHENITKFQTENLTKSVEDKKICHDKLCCTFTVKFAPQEHKDYVYKLAVYGGSRMFKSSQYNVQVCGIIACSSDKLDSCGKRNPNPTSALQFTEIIITSNSFVDQDNTVIIPTNVLYDLSVLSPSYYTYSAVKSECYRVIEMKTTAPVKEILGFGIYSLTLDTVSPSSDGLSGAVIAIIVIAVLVVIAIIGLLIWKRFKTGSYKHPGGNC